MANYADLFQKYDALIFTYIRTTGVNPFTSQICELAAVRFVVEKGHIANGGQMDHQIRLLPGVVLTEKFSRLLGVTAESLKLNGLYEVDVADEFYKMIGKSERPLLIAHHGQITNEFLNQMWSRMYYSQMWSGKCRSFDQYDFLDTMTVLRDRRPGNGNLVDAFHAYGLKDQAPTGTGMDEVKHLAYVALKMDAERPDLVKYVNVFGVSPNKPVLTRFRNVQYKPQTVCTEMRGEEEILPILEKAG